MKGNKKNSSRLFPLSTASISLAKLTNSLAFFFFAGTNSLALNAAWPPVVIAHEKKRRKKKMRPRKQAPKKTKQQLAAPVVIAHECPSAMRAHVLEVPAGRDVLSCVAQFARRCRRGALVLGASGHVTDVVLRRDPGVLTGGGMEILSLSGCFFPSSCSAGTAVFLAGPRGSVLGGGVCRVVAAGPVVVMLATFVAAALDRLPPAP
jgi:predicted DNA-binding protein with PD1-like motif